MIIIDNSSNNSSSNNNNNNNNNNDDDDDDDERKDNEWDFYFGRGGGSNQKRQVSKANNLVQDLALRYSYCRQTEKRLFAKIEVYDRVLRNGGRFLLYSKQELFDVTQEKEETIGRIMQSFRDTNKTFRSTNKTTKNHTKTTTVTTKATRLSTLSTPTTIANWIPIEEMTATKKTNTSTSNHKSNHKSNHESNHKSNHKSKQTAKHNKKSPRPKRRCIRPSIIEPPVLDCVRDAIAILDTTNHDIDNNNNNNNNDMCTVDEETHRPIFPSPFDNVPIAARASTGSAMKSTKGTSSVEAAAAPPPIAPPPPTATATPTFAHTGVCHLAVTAAVHDDVFDNQFVVVQAPHNHSQHQSNHEEEEKTAAAVALAAAATATTTTTTTIMGATAASTAASFDQWIMADDEIQEALPTDSQHSINTNLHRRVQRLENLVTMLMQQKNEEMERLLK